MKGIRIVAPSGAIDTEYIDQATARLRAWGYIVSEGAHARGKWGRFAGTDDERVADLNEALSDPSVDVILCTRGGYGLQRIIDRIAPITKPIIGFSDITALHQLSAIHTASADRSRLCRDKNCQLSIHGIMCKHIATLPEDSEPIVALRRVLAGEAPEYTWESHPLNRAGEACAPVIGGNLSVLYGLQGTEYGLAPVISNLHTASADRSRLCRDKKCQMSNNQQPILLIEDIAERHYHIDRMMRNLRLSGVLAGISGLIVGQFSDCEDDPSMGCTVYETIKEAVADYDYPVLFNAPIGHVERNLPLWLGVPTQLTVTTENTSVRQLLRG